MALQVIGGWLTGHYVRKARREYRCQYWKGRGAGGRCRALIPAGTYYIEGEMSDGEQTRNGVFIQDKYCPNCAGVEAVATIALIGL